MTILLLFILYLLIVNPNIVATQVVEASRMWFFVLLPIMYPSFVVIDLIEHMPFVSKISKLLYRPFHFIFHIHHEKSAFLILFAILCGSPASTKIFKASYERKEISKTEYQNLVFAFSTLSMPYTLMLLKQFQIVVLLYYGAFLFLASLWMHFKNKKEPIPTHLDIEPIHYLKTFFNSIQKNIQIVLQVLGILIIFRVLIHVIFKGEILFYPFIEILGGLAMTTSPLIGLLSMGFLGFSEHLQIMYIADDIPYPKLLLSRIYYMLLGFLTLL